MGSYTRSLVKKAHHTHLSSSSLIYHLLILSLTQRQNQQKKTQLEILIEPCRISCYLQTATCWHRLTLLPADSSSVPSPVDGNLSSPSLELLPMMLIVMPKNVLLRRRYSIDLFNFMSDLNMIYKECFYEYSIFDETILCEISQYH